MPEESTTPDLVELTHRTLETANRHDLGALMGFYAAEAVWDLSDVGIGTFEGVAAIESFIGDWWGTWGDHVMQAEEIVDLGHGVVFLALREDGRLAGSDAHVEHRRGRVYLWVNAMIERVTVYLDIDQARVAGERQAQERG